MAAQATHTHLFRDAGLVVPRMGRADIPTACGLLGAVIMPYNLFLHSALVQTPRTMRAGEMRPCRKERLLYHNIESAFALLVTLFINTCVISVFAYGFAGRGMEIGLESAGRFLGREFGQSMAITWAVGLLAAGQSSVMTGTFAGQFTMSGFLNLKLSPLKRALITRGVAICPTLAVAWAAREHSTVMDAFNQWLNVLQAVQLPFAIIPLLVLTSSRSIMGPRFVNGTVTATICWLFAVSILGINMSTAYETAMVKLPPSKLHFFWLGAALYLSAVTYLIAAPVGTLIRRIGSRLGSRVQSRQWSVAHLAALAAEEEQGLLQRVAVTAVANGESSRSCNGGGLQQPLLVKPVDGC